MTELAELSLSPDVGEVEIEEAVQQILQLPFFTGSIDLGRLSFSQEVVYDYLLGILATDYFASNPRRFLRLLGVVPFSPDSVTVHVICEHVQAVNGLDDLYRIAMDATPDRVSRSGTYCRSCCRCPTRSGSSAGFRLSAGTYPGCALTTWT